MRGSQGTAVILVLIAVVVAVFLVVPLTTPGAIQDPFPPEGVSHER